MKRIEFHTRERLRLIHFQSCQFLIVLIVYKVPFREGDADLFKAMAEDEAAAGNTTGAATLNTIADRMQT